MNAYARTVKAQTGRSRPRDHITYLYQANEIDLLAEEGKEIERQSHPKCKPVSFYVQLVHYELRRRLGVAGRDVSVVCVD